MKISWKTLDKLDRSYAIYEFLLKNGIKGCRGVSSLCPLALATGDYVTLYRAFNKDGIEKKKLTGAETQFAFEFDRGFYPELEDQQPRKRPQAKGRVNLLTSR